MYSKHKGISFQGCCSYFKPKKEVLTQEKSMLRLNLTDIQTILKQNTTDLCTDSCDCTFWHFVPFEHCQVLVALRGCDVVLPPNSLPMLCNARPEERWRAHEAALVPAGWSRGFSGWVKPRSSCLTSMGLLQACLSWSFCLPRDLLHWYHPTPGQGTKTQGGFGHVCLEKICFATENLSSSDIRHARPLLGLTHITKPVQFILSAWFSSFWWSMFLWQVLCKLATKLLVEARQTRVHTGKQHIEESQVL